MLRPKKTRRGRPKTAPKYSQDAFKMPERRLLDASKLPPRHLKIVCEALRGFKPSLSQPEEPQNVSETSNICLQAASLRPPRRSETSSRRFQISKSHKYHAEVFSNLVQLATCTTKRHFYATSFKKPPFHIQEGRRHWRKPLNLV